MIKQQKLTHSLTQNIPVKQIDPNTALKEINDALMRLAILSQVPNFTEVNGLVLAEWTMENFKHKTLELILDALKNPATLYDGDGNVSRSWRLTHEIVKELIDKRVIEREEQRLRKESEERLNKPVEVIVISDETQRLISDTMATLTTKLQTVPKADLDTIIPLRPKEEVYSVGIPFGTKEDLERRENHRLYILENYDKITGKKLPEWVSEEEWLKLKEL